MEYTNRGHFQMRCILPKCTNEILVFSDFFCGFLEDTERNRNPAFYLIFFLCVEAVLVYQPSKRMKGKKITQQMVSRYKKEKMGSCEQTHLQRFAGSAAAGSSCFPVTPRSSCMGSLCWIIFPGFILGFAVLTRMV